MEQPKARLTLQQHQQAINDAIWIDASPHEWPTVDKMWLLCSALIDSVQMVDFLRARLAAVEAERDAARAEAESTWRCFHCGFCTTDRAKALAHFGDQDEEMALCRWWTDSTDAERVQALQDAIEEQNVAQAGEARAVDLCVKASKTIRWCLESITRIDPIGGMEGFPDELGGVGYDCEVVGASSSSLAWLAQREREAAAKALEMLRDHIQEYIGPDDARDEIRRICANRIKDLRAGNEVDNDPHA